MSNVDVAELLASLRDIHEPAAPDAAWPWVLLGLALAVLLMGVLWRKRPKPKRTVVQQQIDAARHEPADQALVRLARLLRKHTQQNHNASGDSWLALLDTQFDTQFFTGDTGRIFGNALYQKREHEIDIDKLCDHLQTLFDARKANKVGIR